MILVDPYQLLGVAHDASDADVLKAYARVIGRRPPDVGLIAQAMQDLRNPPRRLAIDMLVRVAQPTDAEIDAMLDASGELESLAPARLADALALTPILEIEAPEVLVLVARPELDDEPIVVPELEP